MSVLSYYNFGTVKALVGSIEGDVKVEKDIPEQLTENGLPLSSVNAIIWSHSHIDHVGDPSLFPSSVNLVVGPGFRSEHMPGYPANPQALLLDSAFTGRSVREVDFSTSSLTIGGFRAIDYFQDGSFYLLDAPGHTMHHLCALARTTQESFVLLAADACHHMGQLRPSAYLPLPDAISLNPSEANPISGSAQENLSTTGFRKLLPESKDTEPFYGLNEGLHDDIVRAEDTLEKLQAFDANDNVLVIIAHDWSLLRVLDLYPRDINQWRGQNWGELARWKFLADFEDAVAMDGK
jgi:glyoxylase-like metal-dependent hydrolase (beta-lactamase superfamily II)